MNKRKYNSSYQAFFQVNKSNTKMYENNLDKTEVHNFTHSLRNLFEPIFLTKNYCTEYFNSFNMFFSFLYHLSLGMEFTLHSLYFKALYVLIRPDVQIHPPSFLYNLSVDEPKSWSWCTSLQSGLC